VVLQQDVRGTRRGEVLKDPYKVLGVDRNASKDKIQKAYRAQARKYHPDANKEEDATEKFKEVTAAYEILNDDRKKAEYDRFGNVGGYSTTGHRKPFTSPVDDFFSSMFGAGAVRQARGEDIMIVQEVDLMDVLRGGDADIKYDVNELCKSCNGTGGEEDACSHCGGSGSKIIHGQAMTVKTACPACEGTGKSISKACADCDRGVSGTVEQEVNFKIPQGVEDGMRFALKGMGHPCADGITGNLYVVISIKKHDLFDRLPQGNLLCRVPVTYTQLVFGCEMDVPTLDGKVNFKIPEGTQSGTKFRLKGLGLPVFNKGGGIYNTGDELIQVDLEVPTNISEEHRSILKNLAAIEQGEK